MRYWLSFLYLLCVSIPLRAAGPTSSPLPVFTAMSPSVTMLSGRVVLRDINGDGLSDVLIPSSSLNRLTIAVNQGNRKFAVQAPLAASGAPGSVDVGDVTGDGRVDIVLGCMGLGQILVFPGTATGFGVQRTILLPKPVSGVALADLNGDGIHDIFCSLSGNPGGAAVVRGGTSFGTPSIQAGANGPVDIAVGDLTGDGILDAVVANQTSRSVSVFPGLPDGTLGPRTDYTGGHVPYDVVVADVDGNSLLDIVVADNRMPGIWTLYQTTPGVLGRLVEEESGAYAASIAAQDVNRDGLVDVLWTSQASNVITLAQSRIGQEGHVFDIVQMPLGSSHMSLDVQDLDADGWPDIASSDASGNLSVWWNAIPIPESLIAERTSLQIGGFTEATVTLNRSAPPNGAEVSLWSSDPNVVFSPPSVRVPEGQRTGTFMATAPSAGTAILRASLNNHEASTSLEVRSEGAIGLPGDMDADGELTIADATILLRVIGGMGTPGTSR